MERLEVLNHSMRSFSRAVEQPLPDMDAPKVLKGKDS